MKKYFLTLAAAVLLTSHFSLAQEKSDKTEKGVESTEEGKSKKSKKLSEYDEIIIKQKDGDNDANKKITIEIHDGKVTVDGKPIDEYTDDEVSVRLRRPNRYQLSPSSPFRSESGGWSEAGAEDKAFLGVSTEGSTDGAKVITLSENSAAAKAGLKKGDVITSIAGKKVFDHEQLSAAVADLKPDQKVTIEYKRDGKNNKTTATLGRRPANFMLRAPHPGMPSMPGMPPGAPMPMPPMQFEFDGKNFHDFFNYREKPRLGIKAQDTEDGKGVKVIDVDEGSAADKAGIKEEDIVTAFEGKDVNSAEELARMSKEMKDKQTVKLQIKRNGRNQTIEVKVPRTLKTAEL